MNTFVRTMLMTAFEINDRIFQEYTKKEIINGFLQKPISLHYQLHTYELQKQEALIKT